MPPTRLSPKFISTLEKEKSWKSLKLFETYICNPHVTFFTGNSVWAAEWCPVLLDNTDIQYLAIAASSSKADSVTTLSSTQNDKGFIQIWDCGQLNQTFDMNTQPHLTYCICHNYGRIWDMDWCPGGTAFHVESKTSNRNSFLRLGLLALACSDGKVRVHSMPDPNELQEHFQKPSVKPLMVHNEPVAVLCSTDVNNSTGKEKTICRCVAWSKAENQRYIAAGFGNGIIAVWDLSNKSKLLLVDEQTQTVLRPKFSWIAHGASVNRIKWAYTADQAIIKSCSIDRTAKIWDLRNLGMFGNSLKFLLNYLHSFLIMHLQAFLYLL